MSVNKLVDVEWNIGVTAASSSEETTGQTFLHFKFLMDKNGTKEVCHMDLSPSDFFKLLHEMEKAKSNLDTLIGGATSAK